MSIVIRDVREHELDSVLALNNAAGPAILPLDEERLERFFRTAGYFRVAEREDSMAGFLVGFSSGSGHGSSNFNWFGERYPDFFYIDRIVVASRRRGGGVGRALYADVQSFAELRHPQLACEVFLGIHGDQASDPALLFHGSFGFREVGQHLMQGVSGGEPIRAAMLMKELCSYPWVQETYGNELPEEPWLAARSVASPNQRRTGT